MEELPLGVAWFRLQRRLQSLYGWVQIVVLIYHGMQIEEGRGMLWVKFNGGSQSNFRFLFAAKFNECNSQVVVR